MSLFSEVMMLTGKKKKKGLSVQRAPYEVHAHYQA